MDIFPLISMSDSVGINGLTRILKIIGQVWCQTHYDAIDRYNYICFEYLDIISLV
jgi:hypothetical protein